MKTAILVAVSEDGRTGQPLTGVLPYDQAARQLKTATEVPAGFAALELYVKGGKRRKLKSFAAPVEEPAAEEPAAEVETTSEVSSGYPAGGRKGSKKT